MALLDLARPDDTHVYERLQAERVIWFSTVDDAGRPHSVPVWFEWSDQSLVVFSAPGTRKLANIEKRPLVSLALDTAAGGRDVVLLQGTARVEAGLRAQDLSGYAGKYGAVLAGFRDLAEFSAAFSVAVRVTVTRIIAWVQTDDGLQYRSVP